MHLQGVLWSPKKTIFWQMKVLHLEKNVNEKEQYEKIDP
jgi:hypothetical protein